MAGGMLGLSLSIAATLGLVVVDGVFVAAEFAIVRDRADEKTLGIVTLEDVLESLVGDVREAPLEGNPPC